MRYRYFTCDVFTDTPLCGNQLAVLPEAEGLTDHEMQQIAREFNFAETTFVFPAESDNSRKVRIFTPALEIPFAGHPNIGTAFTLALDGAFGEIEEEVEVRFEEAAGLVRVSIERRAEDLWCELEAPQSLTLGEQVSPRRLASVLSLEPEDIVTDTHPPIVASVGLPFLVTEVSDRDALRRISTGVADLRELEADGICPDVHVYTRSEDEFDIRARMFAPLHAVPEDPATGSANCALAALLTQLSPEDEGNFSWRISQGVELGRPSVLDARTEKRSGSATRVWIGGSCVLVSEGTIECRGH